MRSGDGLRSGAQGAAPQAATVASSSPSATVATISSSSSSPSDRKVKSPSLSSDEAVIPASMPIPGAAETKGWLYKWTNYIKGYQKRWFVLSNGLLSYYRYQAEMSHTCRGTISLHGANIHTEDACNFIVSNGGGTQTFHLRASSEVERQRWVTALELAKAQAQRSMDGNSGGGSSEDESELQAGFDGEMGAEITKQELANVVKALSARLEDLTTCSNLIGKHGTALTASLNELNLDKLKFDSPEEKQLHKERVKTVTERSALLKLTSNAMVKASGDFVSQCHADGRKWQRLLINEREIRQRLEDMVEQLAKQHSQLETMVRKEYHLSDPESTTAVTAKNSSSAAATGMSSPARNSGSAGNSSSSASAKKNEDAAKKKVAPDGSGDRHHRQDVRSVTSGSGSDDEDEFEDAMDTENHLQIWVTAPPHANSEAGSKDDDVSDEETENSAPGERIAVYMTKSPAVPKSAASALSRNESDGCSSSRKSLSCDLDEIDASSSSGAASASPGAAQKKKSLRERRVRIPDKPNISISLWGIVKNSIGKDLTKIPVPVNFSEPLSMLQRLTEDFEYNEILDQAAAATDNCEQMAYVAAFSVSAYSTTAVRSSKPFNPLLGETYECDRSDDKGFRCISEQVSHHPPMVAQYAESSSGLWQCWQEFSMRSKFKGKWLEVEPLGIAHLVFPKTGNHYTWRKVKTVVHNIVIGKLWVDQHGEMSVNNHKTGDKCHMKFEPYSYFGGTAKKVTGTVVNSKDKVEWVLNGTWDSKLEGSKVINESVVKGKSSLECGPSRLLWRVNPIPPEAEKYYFFSKFACELNELEDNVAPTDSRLRPDQRMMEETFWDEANEEKLRLEEKQRTVRRQREEEAAQAAKEGRQYEGYQPTWFKRIPDEQNGGKYIFTYKGGYWEAKASQNWQKCPDIY